MYSELNKKINSCRNLALQFNQPAEIQVSSSLRLPLECSKSESFWVLFLEQSPGATYMSTAAKISLISTAAHQEQRKKLTKNINLKRELLTVPPRQRRQNLIELNLHTESTEF